VKGGGRQCHANQASAHTYALCARFSAPRKCITLASETGIAAVYVKCNQAPTLTESGTAVVLPGIGETIKAQHAAYVRACGGRGWLRGRWEGA
jgi:hypothetical protein